MAIQMRRGKNANFDPTKMLPGEWAVSVDSDTAQQNVWMCFAPGVVKQMATLEDLQVRIGKFATFGIDENGYFTVTTVEGNDVMFSMDDEGRLVVDYA